MAIGGGVLARQGGIVEIPQPRQSFLLAGQVPEHILADIRFSTSGSPDTNFIHLTVKKTHSKGIRQTGAAKIEAPGPGHRREAIRVRVLVQQDSVPVQFLAAWTGNHCEM